MKKKNVFLLILNLFLVSSILFGQQIQSIKVTTKVAKCNFGNYLPGDILWNKGNNTWDNHMLIYDKDGNIIEDREYSTYCHYNISRRKYDTIIYYTFVKNKYSNKRIIEKEYGQSENATGIIDNRSSTYYKYGENKYTEVDTYTNYQTTLVSKIIIKENDTLTRSTIVTTMYKGNGDLLSIIVEKTDTSQNHDYTYDCAEYNDKKDLISFKTKELHNETDGKYSINTHKYDISQSSITDLSIGDMESVIEKEGNELHLNETEMKEYDKNGNELKDSIPIGDGAFVNHIHIYDEKQNIITTSFLNPENYADYQESYNYESTYKYDNYGNWTEQEVINTDKNIPIYFIERTIKYFPESHK